MPRKMSEARVLPIAKLRLAGCWPAALLCLSPLVLPACQSQSQSAPVVALRYEFGGCLGDGTTKLVATVTAPGRTFESVEYSPPGPGTQSIALRLPSDLSGTISVRVDAKNASDCLVASGTAQVDLSVKRDSNNPADDIKVPLACLSVPDCVKSPPLDPTIQPELLWSLRCGSDGDDVGTGTAFDEQGNVYVVGSFSGRAAGPACTFTGPAGDPNRHLAKLTGGSFLIKLSPSGVVQWSRKLGGIQGSAPVQFDVKQPRLAVTPGGEVYVAGVATQNARIETATTNLADAPFVARFDSSGNLSWQRSFGATTDANVRTRVGALTASTRNGQPVLVLAGDCAAVGLIAADDCKVASQFVMYFEGAERLGNVTTKMFREASPQIGSFFTYSLTSITRSPAGEITITGSSGNRGISESDSGVSPQQNGSSMYVIRGKADGTWSGGFQVEAKSPGEFARNFDDSIPYALERQPNHNLIAVTDRSGNTYLAASFFQDLLKIPVPRIQRYSMSSTVADWTSEMHTQDTEVNAGHPVNLALDSDDNPVLLFEFRKLWTLGGVVQINAPRSGFDNDHDIAIVKYYRSYSDNLKFLWSQPMVVSLGDHSIVGFDMHRLTNRMSLVSRTMNTSVLLNNVSLKLEAPSGKSGKYDLVLLVMGPPGS